MTIIVHLSLIIFINNVIQLHFCVAALNRKRLFLFIEDISQLSAHINLTTIRDGPIHKSILLV